MEKINSKNHVIPKYKSLIHLDRLSITLYHYHESRFKNIRNYDYIKWEQKYDDIILRYNNSAGNKAFYHSFDVYYQGNLVGILHSASKLKKPDILFEYKKEVLYSISLNYWYEIYLALREELGIYYNNINYVEISVDTDKNIINQFGEFYQYTINNKFRVGERYRLRKGTVVNVMKNGSSFLITGAGKEKSSEVTIYDKSKFSEDFILNYFEKNGLEIDKVKRIESRLHSNYFRYLRTRKGFDITLETLLDIKQLLNLFTLSVKNKIEFKDLESKSYDKNRNLKNNKISIIDDLNLESAEIGKLNSVSNSRHYSSERIDENILRQTYFQYIDSGNVLYFRNIQRIASAAGYGQEELQEYLKKFESKYKGSRTPEKLSRMNKVFVHYSKNNNWFTKVMANIIGKLE